MTHEIISNLLENAMRYAVQEIGIRLAVVGGAVEISVENDGPCVEEEHLPHLFNLFYRVEGAPKKGQTGLGLQIVRLIAEAHGGSVHAENIDGRTRFVVSIPLASDGCARILLPADAEL